MSFLSFEEFFHSDYYLGLYCEKIPQEGSDFTTHSGIIVKAKDGRIYLFHFAWHKTLRFETNIPRNKSVYIGLNGFDKKLDSRRLNTESFLNLCKEVFEKNKETILYGLALSKLTKFIGHKLETKEGTIGLTCSTFIMTFFKSYDKELIDINTWKKRKKEDEAWKKYMIIFMRKHGVDEAHIEEVGKEEIMFRFKPEEVVSSSLKYPDDLKAEFDFCLPKGKSLKSILKN